MDLKQIELKDTVEMMNSGDYKERFKAELHQTGIRLGKLKFFVEKYENGELDFTPTCSIELLKNQIAAMNAYIGILYERAEIEQIDV